VRPHDFVRGSCAIVESETGERWWQHWRPIEGAGAKHAQGFYGEDSDCNPVFVKRYRDADEQVISAMTQEVDRLNQVQDCPNVVQFLGVGQVAGGDSCLVFELAESTLTDHPCSVELGAALRRDVGAALIALHDLGLIHSDVAPNNILRVGDTWKLADFDSCVEIGSDVQGHTMLERYRAPGLDLSVPAEIRFDTFGLNAIVERYGRAGE
jgi:serine/threonine protein kinase